MTVDESRRPAQPTSPSRPRLGRDRSSLLTTVGFQPPSLGWSDLSPLALSRREFTVQGAALFLMAMFLASAVLGAVRQILLGAEFGANEVTGAFGAASRLPDVLFTLVAGGALSSALLPVLAATRRESGDAAAWRLASLVLNALVLTLLVISVIGIFAAPWLVRALVLPEYAPASQDLAITMTRIMLLQPVILGAGTVITAWLNSRNRFFLPAIGVACHNVGILSGIGAAIVFPGVGIWGPVWGVVGGAVLQLAITAFGLIGEAPGSHWVARIDLNDRGLRDVAILLVPNGISTGVNYVGWLVETSFGSRVDDAATLVALQNAWLVAGLSVTLLGAAIGQATFPRMAAYAAAGARDDFSRLVRRSLTIAMLGSLPVVGGLLLLGDWLVRLLFEHGDFDADATRLTQGILVAYAVGLPFYIGTEIASRAVLATRDARTPLLTNTMQLAIRTATMATFLPIWGVVAIPLAFAISSGIESVVLIWYAHRRTATLRPPGPMPGTSAPPAGSDAGSG